MSLSTVIELTGTVGVASRSRNTSTPTESGLRDGNRGKCSPAGSVGRIVYDLDINRFDLNTVQDYFKLQVVIRLAHIPYRGNLDKEIALLCQYRIQNRERC